MKIHLKLFGYQFLYLSKQIIFEILENDDFVSTHLKYLPHSNYLDQFYQMHSYKN